jgi:OOP family OmpA-OmpF porin
MKRLINALVLASSLLAGAAFAQVGWYGGASVGMSDYSSSDCVGNCDKTDWGMKLFGGYMFTPYIGLELDYGWFGTANLNARAKSGQNVLAEVKTDGYSGWIVGQYPIDQWRLFGKLGFARLDTQVTAQAPGTTLYYNNNDPSFQFAWALGGAYMFDKNLGIRAEYEARKYKFESSDQTMGFWSVGVQYHF